MDGATLAMKRAAAMIAIDANIAIRYLACHPD